MTIHMNIYLSLIFLVNFLLIFPVLSTDICQSSLQSLEGLRNSLKFYERNYKTIDFDGYSGFKMLESMIYYFYKL